jgi:fatty acid synthase subunit beta
MVAANPNRVHSNKFKHKDLQTVISEISKNFPERLLEIVNFNVENYQYVVAGELTMLCTLGFVLDLLKEDLRKMEGAALQALILECMTKTESQADLHGRVHVERGQVTIPLPGMLAWLVVCGFYFTRFLRAGIDVPFHSAFLKNGVPTFRQVLLERMREDLIDSRKLVGRYIPNVVAKPFALDLDFVALVHSTTNSDILANVIKNYADFAKTPQRLTYVLLIELLAYQFATPVQWIQTQHLFFTSMSVEKLIEIGPAPTLFTMAKRTLELGSYSPLISREILWYGRDQKKIYFEAEDAEEKESAKESASPSAPQPIAQPIAQPMQPMQPMPQPSGAPSDAAPSLSEFIQVLIAAKTGQALTAVPVTRTIKDVVAGKSALQNELVGEIEGTRIRFDCHMITL